MGCIQMRLQGTYPGVTQQITTKPDSLLDLAWQWNGLQSLKQAYSIYHLDLLVHTICRWRRLARQALWELSTLHLPSIGTTTTALRLRTTAKCTTGPAGHTVPVHSLRSSPGTDLNTHGGPHRPPYASSSRVTSRSHAGRGCNFPAAFGHLLRPRPDEASHIFMMSLPFGRHGP